MINQILVGGKWVDGEPTEEGQKYRKKISVGNSFGYEETSFTFIEPTPSLPLETLVITRNGGLAVPQNGQKYYLDTGDTVEVVGTIQGGEAIDAPLIKLPITRHADDQPTADELYFTGSIVAGVLTVSGTFAMSSNYKALNDRCNRALDRMPAGFNVSFDDIDFLV
jgi:hypothetical protein